MWEKKNPVMCCSMQTLVVILVAMTVAFHWVVLHTKPCTGLLPHCLLMSLEST